MSLRKMLKKFEKMLKRAKELKIGDLKDSNMKVLSDINDKISKKLESEKGKIEVVRGRP